jgi:hypothetical protein
MTHDAPPVAKGQALLIFLCLLAGFTALSGLSAATATLLFGIGPGGLVAALLCGAIAVGAASWAALLACGAPPGAGVTTAPGS